MEWPDIWLPPINLWNVPEQERIMDVEESEVAIKHLKEIQEKIGDVEIAHVMADDVLCELLIRLGYSEVVKQYTNIDKWYA